MIYIYKFFFKKLSSNTNKSPLSLHIQKRMKEESEKEEALKQVRLEFQQQQKKINLTPKDNTLNFQANSEKVLVARDPPKLPAFVPKPATTALKPTPINPKTAILPQILKPRTQPLSHIPKISPTVLAGNQKNLKEVQSIDLTQDEDDSSEKLKVIQPIISSTTARTIMPLKHRPPVMGSPIPVISSGKDKLKIDPNSSPIPTINNGKVENMHGSPIQSSHQKTFNHNSPFYNSPIHINQLPPPVPHTIGSPMGSPLGLPHPTNLPHPANLPHPSDIAQPPVIRSPTKTQTTTDPAPLPPKILPCLPSVKHEICKISSPKISPKHGSSFNEVQGVKPAILNLKNNSHANLQRPNDNSGKKDITTKPPKVQSTQVNNKNIKQISPETPEIIDNKAAKSSKTGENNSLFTQISDIYSDTSSNFKNNQNQPVNSIVNKPNKTANTTQKPTEQVPRQAVPPKHDEKQQTPVSQKPTTQKPTTQPLKPQPRYEPTQPVQQNVNPVLIKHPVLWEGKINLKIKDIMTQMHYITGNREISQKILGPQVGNELLKTLKISQRMRLNPDQILKSTNMIAEGQNCVTLCAVPCGVDEIDRGHQSETMKKHFIEYRKFVNE